MLEHGFSVLVNPLLDQVDVNALRLVLLLFELILSLAFFVSSLLKAFKLRDLLLGEALYFLQLIPNLADLLLLLSDLLLLRLEVLAGRLLELEESVLVELLLLFNLFSLLLLLIKVVLQGLDPGFLHSDLLANGLLLRLLLSLELRYLAVQVFHLHLMLLLDSLGSLDIVLHFLQLLKLIVFSCLLLIF